MLSFLRFLFRNKFYVIVEVIGISVAIAFTIPFLSLFSDKWDIDHGRDYRRIYAVCPEGSFETTMGLGQVLAGTVPEIARYAQVYVSENGEMIHVGDNALNASSIAVSPDFFHFFDVELTEGTGQSLTERRRVLVSESFAAKIGLETMGTPLVCAGEEYVVSGVFKDVRKSLLPSADVIFSIEAPLLDAQWAMPAEYWDDIFTFIQLRKGAGWKSVSEKCKAACQDYYASYYARHPDYRNAFKLRRYDRISSNVNNTTLTQTWGLSLWAVELFGLILFVFALLNYVNLNVALSSKRGKEWAMKKLLGSTEQGIRRSSFRETLLVTSVCFLLGYALSRLILPVFNSFFLVTHTSVDLDGSLTVGKVLLYAVFVVLLAAVTAVIPSKVAGRFSAIDIVNGGYRARVKKDTSNVLIGVQCFLTIVLLSVSILFYAQYRKMADRNRGEMAENVFVISGNYAGRSLSVAADALRTLPFVQSVGRSEDCPGDGNYSRVSLKSDDGVFTSLYVLRCDRDAVEAFGFATEDGKRISEGLWLTDAARDLFASGRTGLDYGDLAGKLGAEVKGFLSDFVVNPENDTPAALLVSETGDFNRLVIRTSGRSDAYPETMLKTFREAFSEMELVYEPPKEAGYLEQFFENSLRPTKAILSMVAVFALLALLLTILGLVAMSSYYISLHRKDSAVRKVFGATIGEEVFRNVSRYLKVVLIASVIGIILAVLINNAVLESYTFRLSCSFWVYLLSLAVILGIALFSVFYQSRAVAEKDPVFFLREQ